ncbi:MAG: ankyrin repeat domain-containing protein, partial [Gammaproteobacteria bacterium]|nr:ankyrin repeat domain-containing protein [Gammaproteobacteria bacterium]
LFVAAEKGHLGIVQALLESGATVNQPISDGTTPLYMAAYNAHLGIVQALLESGANVNQPMRDGFTPLFVAAENGHIEIVQALLESGTNVNQPTSDGIPPLYIAAQNGHLDIVQQLLTHPEIDITIPFQSTKDALIKFAQNKTTTENPVKERMMQFIEAYKTSDEEQTCINITPEQIAHIMGHESLAEIFETHKDQHTDGLKP